MSCTGSSPSSTTPIETGHVDVAGDWSAVAVWRRHDLEAQQRALGDYHLLCQHGSGRTYRCTCPARRNSGH
ncbi:hypothetical protein ACFFMM_11760 [Micromonospora chaiyaphumensis]|uniref:hypothetical protein n=1 Tax=Micromonospora chaiyaphumensis TaxID=307119 RepID=UPI000B889DB4|nr:hypothetical protein [Micromonospora chaiyaphumensis]